MRWAARAAGASGNEGDDNHGKEERKIELPVPDELVNAEAVADDNDDDAGIDYTHDADVDDDESDTKSSGEVEDADSPDADKRRENDGLIGYDITHVNLEEKNASMEEDDDTITLTPIKLAKSTTKIT